ncbi:unnamed protein product [Caenorhabditis sp. 36 PRJEB53466]|nr:unnamed protein product [Caenorhabditis sp. 36 PRJEB53466]
MASIPCQICGKPGHGTHFGAVSCRACAAFFRRSIIDNSDATFKCLRGNDDCSLKFVGKFYCKKCRLQTCFDKGMDPKHFQHGRDKIKAPSPPIIPESMSTFVGRPAFIIHCVPSAGLKKSMVDVTDLIEKAADLLRFGAPSVSIECLGILEKMSRAHRLAQKTENGLDFQQVPVLGERFFLHYWETDLLKTAKWLTHFDGFQCLPLAVQLQVLMATWHLRARLDRLSTTAKLRKNARIGEHKFMIDNRVFLDLKSCKLDVSWCSKYTNDEIKFFLEESDDWVHNELVQYLEDLNPSDIEISFMMCQLCFHYAGKRFQGDVLVKMEQFEDVISDDLHKYYENQNVRNYSERLGKMMKINNMLQKIIWEKRWKTELAKTFDIFYVDFSHPEMFQDCC